MDLSIVTTLFQSAAFIDTFYDRVRRAAEGFGSFEIVLVNDGSPDDSLQRAIGLFERDPRVRIVDLSRNFGHHKAMMTGLQYSRGDLVFLLDSDLEEDPAWLEIFAETLRTSRADVVYGVQRKRSGGLLNRITGAVYYAVFNALLEHPIPRNVMTARLMTRRYVDQLVRHRDRELCLAGLWAITGFLQVPMIVEKGQRQHPTYGNAERFSVMVNALTSFSTRPLVLIFYAGCIIMLVSAAAGGLMVFRALRHGIGVPGWASLIVSVWFLGGLTIFALGIIGIYLSKIFMETKERPYTVVRAEYSREVQPL
jgi:putative glycosyltransferase